MVLNCTHTTEENLDKRLKALNQESVDTLERSKTDALVARRSVLMDTFLKIGPRASIRLFKVSQCLKERIANHGDG